MTESATSASLSSASPDKGAQGDKAHEAADRQLSPVLENYLEIIFYLETREGAARASSIAETAGVSRSTVTSALKALQAMGFVDYKPYSLIHLTENGLAIGRDIAHRHLVFQEFFEHILQLEPAVASDVACELEHVVPPDVIRRVGQFVLYLNTRTELWEHWQDEYRAMQLKKQHKGQPAAPLFDPGSLPPVLASRMRAAQTESAGENGGKSAASPHDADPGGGANRYR